MSRPVRVLWVADKVAYGDHLNGAGSVWLNVLPVVDPSRCRIIPCVLRVSPFICERFAHLGVKLRNLDVARFDLRVTKTLCRLVREEAIDILHLQGYQATMVGRLAGMITRTPVIVHQHDRDPRYPWYMGAVDRLLASSTTVVIAVSGAVERFCRTRRHLGRRQSVVLHNAVRPRFFRSVPAKRVETLRRSLHLPEGAPVIGAVTRFHPDKDVPTMLEAVGRIAGIGPNWHLVIAGDGSGQAAVEAQVRSLGLTERTRLVGFQLDVQPILALMDAVVFSSVSEGSPMSVLEAMAAGRPIVATAIDGVTDLLVDGHNALLVPIRDPAAMAQAVERLLTDRALADRLGRQARKDARSYSLARYVDRLHRLYAEVAAAHGRIRSVATTAGTHAPDWELLRTLQKLAPVRLVRRLPDSSRKNRGDLYGLLLRRYPDFVFNNHVTRLDGEVPVFVFHDVRTDRFRAQLQYLRENGYRTLESADALHGQLQGRDPIDAGTVMLTFDDGLDSLYASAFPLLRRERMHATAFVIPGLVGRPGFCTWDQLKEMRDSGLVDIQSHTLYHRYAPRWPVIMPCGPGVVATDAPAAMTMEEDYQRSRELIEAKIDAPVRHLCYPAYDGTATSIVASQNAGYVSNFWGVMHGRRTNRPGDDAFRIARLPETYIERLPGHGRQPLPRVVRDHVGRQVLPLVLSLMQLIEMFG